MKQSAVEWLEDMIAKMEAYGGDLPPLMVHIKKAKEMEKEQIIDAGNSCALKQHLHSDRINKMNESELRQFAEEEHLTFGEEYYNETFNKSTQWQWYNEDQTDERMNVIGQNGNDGEHYNK